MFGSPGIIVISKFCTVIVEMYDYFPLKSSNLQGIVIVEKTQMSEQYFPAVQKFTVLDLGMVLLPVANQLEASCLIVQLVSTDSTPPQ